MAKNGSKFKRGLNLIGVLDYIFLISTLVFSLSALLNSIINVSIGPLFVGIVVLIGLLTVIGVLCLIHCCKSNSDCNDRLFNVIYICIRLWCSCVLGLVSYVDMTAIQNETTTTAITWMLLISIGIKAVWSIVQRCFGLIKYSPSPVTWAEMLELVGFSVTGIIVFPKDQAFFSRYTLFVICVSLGCTVVALRLIALSYNPVVIFILIIVTFLGQVGLYIYFRSSFYVHEAALCCSAYRLLTDPVFDLLFRKPFVLSSKSIGGPSKVVIDP